MTVVTFTATVRAFCFETIPLKHKISVDHTGDVRVWDTCAGYYTSVHSLSSAQKARLRRIARENGLR